MLILLHPLPLFCVITLNINISAPG